MSIYLKGSVLYLIINYWCLINGGLIQLLTMKPQSKQKWSLFILVVLFCSACLADDLTANRSVEEEESKEVLDENDEETTKAIDESKSQEIPPKENPATIKEEPTITKKAENPAPEVKKDAQPGMLLIIMGIR